MRDNVLHYLFFFEFFTITYIINGINKDINLILKEILQMKTMTEVVNGLDTNVKSVITLNPTRKDEARLELIKKMLKYDGGDLFDVSYTSTIYDGYKVSINICTTPINGDWETILTYYNHNEFIWLAKLAILSDISVELNVSTTQEFKGKLITDVGVIGIYINSGDVGSMFDDTTLYENKLADVMINPKYTEGYVDLCKLTKGVLSVLIKDPRVETVFKYSFQSEEVLGVLDKHNDILKMVMDSIENKDKLTVNKIIDNCNKLKDFIWVIDYVYKLGVMFDNDEDHDVIVEMDNN